jgi:hypothetical protein
MGEMGRTRVGCGELRGLQGQSGLAGSVPVMLGRHSFSGTLCFAHPQLKLMLLQSTLGRCIIFLIEPQQRYILSAEYFYTSS